MTLHQAERVTLQTVVLHKQNGQRVLIKSIERDDENHAIWISGWLPAWHEGQWREGCWHHADLALAVKSPLDASHDAP